MNKVILMRRIQTGGYTNCDGPKDLYNGCGS